MVLGPWFFSFSSELRRYCLLVILGSGSLVWVLLGVRDGDFFLVERWDGLLVNTGCRVFVGAGTHGELEMLWVFKILWFSE